MNRPPSQRATPSGNVPGEAGSASATPVSGAAFWRVLGMGVLMGFVLGLSLLWLLQRPQVAPIVVHAPPTPAPLVTPTPAPIQVHVSGAVAQPGLYTLSAGARVNEAVQAAGGLLPNAAGETVNLAAFVGDGARLHVAAEGELVPPELAREIAGDTRSGSMPAHAALVNLNTATQAELETLPGIGPAKALEIIAARPFDSIEDLDRVPGIGATTLDELRPLVTIQ